MPDLIELRLLEPPARLPADMAHVIAGPPGPPGGATYVHTQSSPAAVWTVAHNLGRHPSITVTDHLGNVLIADVQYLDASMVQITHSVPAIGCAYCN